MQIFFIANLTNLVMSKTFYHSTILDFMHQDQRGHWVSIYLEATNLTHKSRVWILVLDPFYFQVLVGFTALNQMILRLRPMLL